MIQNNSFDEIWSLNPSERRNQGVEKSVEIPIGNGRKPYCANKLNSHICISTHRVLPTILQTQVFIRFKRGLFYCLSLVALSCLNQYGKEQVKILVFDLVIAKYKCDCLQTTRSKESLIEFISAGKVAWGNLAAPLGDGFLPFPKGISMDFFDLLISSF